MTPIRPSTPRRIRPADQASSDLSSRLDALHLDGLEARSTPVSRSASPQLLAGLALPQPAAARPVAEAIEGWDVILARLPAPPGPMPALSEPGALTGACEAMRAAFHEAEAHHDFLLHLHDGFVQRGDGTTHRLALQSLRAWATPWLAWALQEGQIDRGPEAPSLGAQLALKVQVLQGLQAAHALVSGWQEPDDLTSSKAWHSLLSAVDGLPDAWLDRVPESLERASASLTEAQAHASTEAQAREDRPSPPYVELQTVYDRANRQVALGARRVSDLIEIVRPLQAWARTCPTPRTPREARLALLTEQALELKEASENSLHTALQTANSALCRLHAQMQRMLSNRYPSYLY